MAGSLKWGTYTDDAGADWAVFVDESNFEAVNGAGLAVPPTGQNYKPPSNLKPRYAVYGNAEGTRNLRVVVSTLAIYNALTSASTIPDQITGGGATLSLVRKRPEVISPVPTAFDSGLNDGDQP